MVTRIRQLLDWQQLSPTQFADLIGVGRPVMSHILSERNKPSLEVFQRIVEAFPMVSMAWLLSGTGEMLIAPDPTPAATTPAAAPVAAPPAVVTSVATPLLAPAKPLATPGVTTAAPTAPAMSTPRRAAAAPKPAPARFVRPGVPQLVTAAIPAPVEAVAAPVAASAPPVEQAVAPAPVNSLPASSPPAATLLADAAPLPKSGKAIRRIVIFYRDGSFVDYQPEG